MTTLCTITGTLRDLTGAPLVNTQVTFVRGGVAAQDGSTIVPRQVSATSNGLGVLNVTLYAGNYGAKTIGSNGTIVNFSVAVPSTATAVLSDLIDAAPTTVTPQAVTDAQAARDAAQAAATATAADRAQTGLDVIATAKSAAIATTAAAVNRIGLPGQQGFGVGVPSVLPAGFASMAGSYDIASANYGNYQYSDGSIMVWVPAFYYKITGLIIDIKDVGDYGSETTANAAGYALHRAFKDGGAQKAGFFVDKYQCSNNGGIASSIALGLPISTSAAHNPIAGLTGVTVNQYYSAIDGAKSRGAEFFCTSRFIYAALAMLSMAHGQAATASTYCAWYDAGGVTNFPKGCNNNALGDANDATLSFVSDGYSNAAKTGSANNLAKTAHNGQGSGVVDLNGNMLEVSLGLTRPGTTAGEAINDALGTTAFYVAKPSVRMQDFTSGWNVVNDHWGDATHLATLFDVTNLSMITNSAGAWQRFGNAANQVLDGATAGIGNTLTGLGIYKDALGKSAGGTNLFGSDGIYEYWRSNLTVLSGGNWSYGAVAGVWAASLSNARTDSNNSVGFRSACFSV